MQTEELTFEEMQEFHGRMETGVFVPHHVMKAYFTMKHYLESSEHVEHI